MRRRLEIAHAIAAAQADRAEASSTGPPPPSAHAVHRAHAAQRQELLELPGVLGVGLGLGAGRAPVISVFVAEDRAAILEARPRLERIGGGIDVEFVPFHGLRAAPEPPAGPMLPEPVVAAAGVLMSPGDGIGRAAPATLGTLGVFATTAGGDPVAITAMHVAGASRVEPGEPAIPMVRRASLADPGVRVGSVDRGTRTGVDAARIRLADPGTARRDIPTIGDVNGWRWPAFPADIGEGVRLYGATSGRLDGTITHVEVDFPVFSLERTIVASIPTDHGDSGAALVDAAGHVLGFLVGASSNIARSLRLFSPAGLVLDRLGCNLL